MTELSLLAVQNAPLLRELKKEGSTRPANIAELARRLERDESNVRKTIKALDGARLLFATTLRLSGEGIEQLEAIDRAEGQAAAELPGGPRWPEQVGDIRMLLHGQIFPDPANARQDWDSEDARADLEALREDIVQVGLLQNLIVRPTTDFNGYVSATGADGRPLPLFTLVGGERRWRAVGAAIAEDDWPADRPLPCRIIEVDDVGHRLAALSENLQRRALNPIEEARAYQGLRAAGLSTEDIADRVALTQRHVQARLQLLEHLTEDQQRRMTLPPDDPNRLSVSEARKLVQNAETKRKAREKAETDYTPRQRLILAELRASQLAATAYLQDRVIVDHDAVNADPDAVALDKAGLIQIRTDRDSRDGLGGVRFEWSAGDLISLLFPAGPAAGAADLREELELPQPAEGQWSTSWMNGPFVVPDEAKAQLAEAQAAREADEQARRDRIVAWQKEEEARVARWSLTRVHADALISKASEPPAAAVLDDLPVIARGFDHPLPWTPTAAAAVNDANGEPVMSFKQGWRAVDEAQVALAMMTAVAVNTAAGLPTPPLLTEEAEGEDAAGADDKSGDESDD